MSSGRADLSFIEQLAFVRYGGDEGIEHSLPFFDLLGSQYDNILGGNLDDETEKILKQVTKKTGWSVSWTLKRGILALRDEAGRNSHQSAFDIYQRLDLGPGGYAIVASTDTRRGMQIALRRKPRR
jgi:hypothetical protein